ncbi:hypothetical protein IG631_15544 [Alternaria alternata]|nr:hypothetical protein IG631_15544 [Alternaria alternata]
MLLAAQRSFIPWHTGREVSARSSPNNTPPSTQTYLGIQIIGLILLSLYFTPCYHGSGRSFWSLSSIDTNIASSAVAERTFVIASLAYRDSSLWSSQYTGK